MPAAASCPAGKRFEPTGTRNQQVEDPGDPSSFGSAPMWPDARATPVGFEPTRGDPIGLAGRRLSRSAKVSWLQDCRRKILAPSTVPSEVRSQAQSHPPKAAESKGGNGPNKKSPAKPNPDKIKGSAEIFPKNSRAQDRPKLVPKTVPRRSS